MASDVTADELILWIVCPLVLIFGIVGNAISLIVVYRLRHHFLTFTYYLAALSVSDCTLLVFSVLPRWAESLAKLKLDVKYHLLCKIDACVHYASFIASSWYLAGLTAQRAAVVLWPYSVGSPYTTRVSVMVVALVAGTSGLLSFLMLSRDDLNYEECYLGSALKLKYNLPGKVWSWVDSSLVFFIPLVVIAVGNVVIVIHLKASGDKVKQKTPPSKNPLVLKLNPYHLEPARRRVSIGYVPEAFHPKRSRGLFGKNSITCSIIWASVFFCALLGPGYIVEALSTVGLIPEQSLTPVLNVLLEVMEYTNASVNFYIYCLTGERFRKEIKNIDLRAMLRRPSKDAEEEEEPGGPENATPAPSLIGVESTGSRSSILKKSRSASSVKKRVYFKDEMTEEDDTYRMNLGYLPLHAKLFQSCEPPVCWVESPVDTSADVVPDAPTTLPEYVIYDSDIPPVVIWTPPAEQENQLAEDQVQPVPKDEVQIAPDEGKN